MASGMLTEPKFIDALIEGERTLSQRIKEQTEEHQLTLAFPPPPPPSGSPASALALEASQKLKEQVSEQVSNETQAARRV
jgi:hypothetical protein